MVRQLEKKIEEMQTRHYNKFREYTGVDFLESNEVAGKAERGSSMFENFLFGFKNWLSDYEHILDRNDKLYKGLVAAYLNPESLEFESMFESQLRSNMDFLSSREQVNYILHLCEAIIFKQIERKALGRLIDVSLNA